MGETEDPYEQASKSKLKLKVDNGIKKKKKKKDKKVLEKMTKTIEAESEEQASKHLDVAKKTKSGRKRTNAEIAFQKMQEKMQTKRILDKASMTHKERVEKFNQHLDSLTEHFDIPKVSWTK